MNYANFWQSIIAADLEGIKRYSTALGAGDMYGLFTCMLTARSWDVVMTGIDKVAPSEQEVSQPAPFPQSQISWWCTVFLYLPNATSTS